MGENQEVLSTIKRQINQINEKDLKTKKQGCILLVETISELDEDNKYLHQEILLTFCKPLLKLLCDASEKVRESGLQIFKKLVQNCDSMSQLLPYLLPTLADRVNCHDLEGILHLPEVQRPPPSHKPLVLIKLNEPVEELRIQICDLMLLVVKRSSQDEVFNYVDEFVNILRALVMDPQSSIQLQACECISEFCDNNRETLLHFTQPLARALLLALVNPKAKNRIAALSAMTSVLYCGVWKHNAFVMEILIGFKDPNTVGIKEFYEYTTRLNYFAILINDNNASVREAFLKAIGDWVSKLPDKYDHHTRLAPYILTGLFDPYPTIGTIAYETIEECGLQLEEEKEKDFRDQKQLGVDCLWTMEGQLVDLPLPSPFKKRPNIGARVYVRSQIRHYLKALYKEVQDNNIEARVKASQLLLMSSVYCEDYLTQFLYQFIPGLVMATFPFSNDILDIQSAERIEKVFKHVGRFCDYKSYNEILFSGLKGDYKENYAYFNANLRALLNCLDGSMEATIKSGLGENKMQELCEVINFISEKKFKDNFGSLNLNDSKKLLQIILFALNERANEEEKLFLQETYGRHLLDLCLIVQYIEIENKILPIKVLNKDLVDETLELIHKFCLKQVKIEDIQDPSVQQLICLTFLQNDDNYYDQIRIKIENSQYPDNIFILLKITIINQFFYKQQSQSVKLVGAICSWCINKETQNYQQIYQNLIFYLQNCNKLSNDKLQNLAEILTYLIKNFKNFKQNEKSFIQQLQIGLDLIENSDGCCQYLKQQDYYIFGDLFDFIVSKIETIQQPNVSLTNLCFNILQNIINLLPRENCEKYYSKYDEFYTNFVRYIIDETDIDLRKQYFQAVRQMASRAEDQLIKVLHYSQRNSMFKRVEIIQACLKKI